MANFGDVLQTSWTFGDPNILNRDILCVGGAVCVDQIIIVLSVNDLNRFDKTKFLSNKNLIW